MKSSKSERGQALVIIALAAVVLFGFAALAIDTSRVYADKRHAQNAADTSALAAALAKIRNQNYTNAAINRAASNGYSNDADSTVTVSICTATTCQGLPAGANASEYIKVRITSIVPMTLGRVVGWQQMTNDVQAIARAKITQTTSSFLAGAGLVAVRNDNSNRCFEVMGTANVTLHNTGIFVNCTGSEALFFNGNAGVSMDANAQVAGCTNNLGFPISPASIQCSVGQQPVDENTFASYPTVLATPTCSGTVTPGNPMTPGNYNSFAIIPNGTTFPAGNYCFNAGVSFGNQSVSVSGTGDVKWILPQGVDLAGSANFDSLEIYASNAEFKLKSSANLDTNRFRFFGNGSSNFVVQGGTFSSDNAYIYSETGEIDINAQANVNMQAPPAGDIFGGILLHMPWDNPNSFELNGGVNNSWTGLILMPHTDVTYNGGNGFELHGQVIGYTFKINGGAQGEIYFESTGVASPPNNPTIELTR